MNYPNVKLEREEKMKKIIIIFFLFLIFYMNVYTIHAEDDEEGTELDLNSEVINTNNSDSLTDKNNIPLLGGVYIYGESLY